MGARFRVQRRGRLRDQTDAIKDAMEQGINEGCATFDAALFDDLNVPEALAGLTRITVGLFETAGAAGSQVVPPSVLR